MFSFLFGFLAGIGAVIALVFVAGAKTRPLLQKRLEELKTERKTTRAKAVKAAASVDRFKVTSIEAVAIQSTPAHISTSGVPCRLAMIGGAITLSTAYALKKKDHPPPSHSADEPQSAPTSSKDRAICTLSAKNLIVHIDAKERNVLHIAPRVSGSFVAEDVMDTVDGKEKRQSWRSLKLTFEGGPREADRWFTVLSPSPATERWIRFVKSVPEGKTTSFNLFVARILFENSAGTTLDEFIAAKIRKKLSHVALPPPLQGSLELMDLRFGDEAPFFTNTEFNGVSSTGEFGFDFDLLYRGGFNFSLSVTLQIGPLKVPNIVLDITIEAIQGKVHMSIGSPPSNKMWVGFHEEPDLRLGMKQDVHLPEEVGFLANAIRGIDISETVSEIVKTKLFEDMILPAMDDLPIPDVGPTPPDSPVAGAAPGAYPNHVPQLSDWSAVEKPAEDEAAVDARLQAHLDATEAATPAAKAEKTEKADAAEATVKKQRSGSTTPTPKASAGSQTPDAKPAAESPDAAKGSRLQRVEQRVEQRVDEGAAKVRETARGVKERVDEILHRRRTPPPPDVAAAKQAAGSEDGRPAPPTTRPIQHTPSNTPPRSPTARAATPPKAEADSDAKKPVEKPSPQQQQRRGSTSATAATDDSAAAAVKKVPSSTATSTSDDGWVRDMNVEEAAAGGDKIPTDAAGKPDERHAAAAAHKEDMAHSASQGPESPAALSATSAGAADTSSSTPKKEKKEEAKPQEQQQQQQQQYDGSTYQRPRYHAQSQPQW